ncbi:MAG: ABC-F family ATP-binding cassette domain-containing protein [Bacteroidetes bacterium]|jgi:ATP-binding cassette subfamily F protein uup|nr:ABC-F family ATP-binding cassette domain-containing protein [Bacteroidota bacterium]
MNYLNGENLSKDLGERILFENLDLSINKGDKIALVANNGTGKSSLLKILAQVEEPDNGIVRLRKGIRSAYLPQEPTFDEGTIQELIDHSSSHIMATIRAYEASLEAQTADYNTETQRAFEQASLAMDQADAWDFERKLKELLTRFTITNYDQPISSLSGGQKKRLAISLAILQNPDLLMLDEPTNHLDLDMIEWLEKYLSNSNMSILMVSHDRYFLDSVCNQIIEMTDGRLQNYSGNYAYFLEKKAEMEAAQAAEIGKAQQLMKTELEWMRRSPKARTTKSKSRISSFYDTEAKAKSGKKTQDLELSVKMSRIGGKILEIKKLYKAYDDNVMLKGFDYTFKKGERIGIVGKNGCGKSTFLNMIMDLEEADSGKINRGDTVVFGYYSQEGMKNLKPGKRVIDVMKDVAEVITLANGAKVTASQMLNLFLFPPQMQNQRVEKLSGGEKRRLYLLTVLMKNPNFLILDEPTNDLDILTLNKLESFLADFGGCILLVSHDRYFLDRIVEHIFVFEGQGSICDYNGSYTEYRIEQEIQAKQEKKAAKKEAADASIAKAEKEVTKTKMSFKEKYEFESLEKEIENLELEKANLEAELADNPTDFDIISKATERLGVVIAELSEKGDRWLELSELEG